MSQMIMQASVDLKQYQPRHFLLPVRLSKIDVCSNQKGRLS